MGVSAKGRNSENLLKDARCFHSHTACEMAAMISTLQLYVHLSSSGPSLGAAKAGFETHLLLIA